MLMSDLLLFLFAYALGFIASVPIGGSQIEIAKRVFSGQTKAAWMIILGTLCADIVYAVTGIFGIAPYMDTPWVLAAFNVAGTLVLWVLAFVTLKGRNNPPSLDVQPSTPATNRVAFLTGFSLAASNPPMIMVWLLGVTLAKQFGLATPFPLGAKVLFIAGGMLGLASYPGMFIMLLHRFKHLIPVHAMGRIYLWLGLTLIVLSLYFVYNALRYFVIGA